MTSTNLLPAEQKILFRWRRAPLEDHLRALTPRWRDQPLIVRSRELPSNASFVNYVRHHRLIDPTTGEQVDLVEKSIRKIAFLSSQEARFYRAQGLLSDSKRFRHPPCLGVIETPWESLVFTTYVRGKPPRMQAIARYLGHCIAEQEHLSHLYLRSRPRREKLLLWSMDFFQPWFLLRPRFNFARYLPGFARLAREDRMFSGMASRLKAFVPLTKHLAKQARSSQRCVSHMDYLRKNLFVNRGHLHLIDWSEVKVGRIGFDGGAYLGSLFRRKDLTVFLRAEAQFIEGYLAGLPAQYSHEDALRNLRYVFLLTALYHTLRPENVCEHRTLGTMPVLLEKCEYLLTLL